MHTVQNLAQAYASAPWRKQVQWVGTVFVGVLAVIMIAGIYLNISSRAAAYGREILIMQEAIQGLQLENADLRTRLGVLLSSATMEKRAKDLGFEPIKTGESTYIVVPGYYERQTVILAPPPQPANTIIVTLPPRFTESLLEWIRSRLFLPGISTEGGTP